MSLPIALLLASLVLGPPSAETEGAHTRDSPTAAARREALRAWLTRPVPRSARFLDHGVIAVAAAGGTPHRYRLELQVGLLDQLSVGVTAHWLPGQRAPQVWPVAALALWRTQRFEIGAHYRPVLYTSGSSPGAQPPDDAPDQVGDQAEGAFVPQTHMALGSAVLSSGWFSVGLDLGAAHTRIPAVDPNQRAEFRRRVVFAGGLFARAGTRRYGFYVDALAVLAPDPLLVFECGVDLRFGAFEVRAPGGWRW